MSLTEHLRAFRETGSREAREAIILETPRFDGVVSRLLGTAGSDVRRRTIPSTEDGVQEVWVRVLRTLRDGGRVPSSTPAFITWVRVTARNIVLDARRKARSLKSGDAERFVSAASAACEAAVAPAVVDPKGRNELVRMLCRGLDGLDREIVRLKFLDGLTWGEVADRLRASRDPALEADAETGTPNGLRMHYRRHIHPRLLTAAEQAGYRLRKARSAASNARSDVSR